MELWEGILSKVLEKDISNEAFSPKTLNQILDSVCYYALNKIRDILKDDSLDDPECFWKIEDIVCVFEEIGSGGGTRHDF